MKYFDYLALLFIPSFGALVFAYWLCGFDPKYFKFCVFISFGPNTLLVAAALLCFGIKNDKES